MAKKPKRGESLLIYGAPDYDANAYYATNFAAGDPLAFFKVRGKSYLWARGLEEDRAKNEATVDVVLNSAEITERLKKKGASDIPTSADYIAEIARMLKEETFLVPENFPLGLADKLRVKGIDIRVKESPFFEERVVKSGAEIKKIIAAEKAVLAAMDEVVKILSASRIDGKKRLVYKDKVLTSEFLRNAAENYLFSRGYLPWNTIIACGAHGAEPHNKGRGTVYAHKPIVCDIFPRSRNTYYWGDFTRTFCVGNPTPKVVRMYEAVKKANETAIKMVKPGVNAKAIHEKVSEMLKSYGFETRQRKDGRWEGFFHGTGHGIGLEIHELPPVSARDHILKVGEVFTIEPGLYYPEEGGVRIEDVVIVAKGGCKVISKYPKTLVIKPKR
ncbi:MAG: Xaa-Pro peptidase family protein [Myxococcota bacterium]